MKGFFKQFNEELKIHAQIEEELFYPAVREAISSDEGREGEDLMDEALVEHAGAKDLIAQLEGMDPDDELYDDAKVTVLSEQIDHYVKEEEEEGEMFPKAKRAKLDRQSLGAEMAARKLELKSATK